MRKSIISVSFILIGMLIFDGCKKPDDGIPDVEKRYVRTVTLFPANIPQQQTISHFIYDDNWNLTSKIGLAGSDTLGVVHYFYTDGSLSKRYVFPTSNFTFDTLSYRYSGDSVFTYWHENGAEYKVSLQLLNAEGKAYYIEDYHWTDGEISVKTEHHWNGNNLLKTVKAFSQSESIITQKFSYNSEVLNPQEGMHRIGYAQSRLYISTIETIEKPNGNQSFTVLEKEDYYPVEVRKDSYIIQYTYY